MCKIIGVFFIPTMDMCPENNENTLAYVIAHEGKY